jgi:multisubunit Na+/H+ antiporter MnhC subunit
MNIQKIAILLAHAFVGWMLCAATMGIGMSISSLENALVVHAIAAPIFFTIVSLVYFRKFNFTTPLQTAVIFTAFVITMDFFVVAILINRSFEMFASMLGTWIPFALIFTSTFLTGLLTSKTDPAKKTHISEEKQ